MSRVRPRPTGVLHLALAFGGAVAALGLSIGTINAFDADAGTAESTWCVEAPDSGAPPNCTYHDFLACAAAAMGAGGSCKAGSSIPANAVGANNQRASEASRQSAKTLPRRMREVPLSATEREQLFRDFVEWNRGRADQTDIAARAAR
ncbi:MAG TPA: DUF3551 domain-containing protein [Xanthobacteraceae bacterium]|nr:DUF3551 domain-containing protein [Xanthobacteraceae bacterium]